MVDSFCVPRSLLQRVFTQNTCDFWRENHQDLNIVYFEPSDEQTTACEHIKRFIQAEKWGPQFAQVKSPLQRLLDKATLFISAVFVLNLSSQTLASCLQVIIHFHADEYFIPSLQVSVERASLTRRCGGTADGEATCWSVQKQPEELAHIYPTVCQLFPHQRQLW